MKLDIRIGRIISAVPVEGADKLLELKVDLGQEERTLVAGIKKSYSPEELIDRKIPVLINLAPRKIMGIESKGMILAAVNEGEAVLLSPDRDIPEGSRLS
ncbi:MAG: methionine--tRNA ligase subunit beta [Elusimicrobia bacterium]|nr:methionine--tRNA ligase subunit beta [Elusimicrobiota bacterium]